MRGRVRVLQLCVLQAMLDVAADEGWLVAALSIINLLQMVIQGRWLSDSTLLLLPHVQPYHIHCFRPLQDGGARRKHLPQLSAPIETLPELMHAVNGRFDVINAFLDQEMSRDQITEVCQLITLEKYRFQWNCDSRVHCVAADCDGIRRSSKPRSVAQCEGLVGGRQRQRGSAVAHHGDWYVIAVLRSMLWRIA